MTQLKRRRASGPKKASELMKDILLGRESRAKAAKARANRNTDKNNRPRPHSASLAGGALNPTFRFQIRTAAPASIPGRHRTSCRDGRRPSRAPAVIPTLDCRQVHRDDGTFPPQTEASSPNMTTAGKVCTHTKAGSTRNAFRGGSVPRSARRHALSIVKAKRAPLR